MSLGPGEESQAPPGGLTRLLRRAAEGESAAAEQVLPLVYEHLRAIARQRMALERAGHTLQATALVHEVYQRVLGAAEISWADRSHFYHVAAEAMRRLLIEHARKRGRVKRGGGGGERLRVPLSVLDLAAEQDEDQILALDGALRRLEGVDPDAAEVVRLRFYAGLTIEQTAEAMGQSPRTTKRDWVFARAWLHQALHDQV
jgi:RNA polymerase sigma factor (TIGR02999 family)